MCATVAVVALQLSSHLLNSFGKITVHDSMYYIGLGPALCHTARKTTRICIMPQCLTVCTVQQYAAPLRGVANCKLWVGEGREYVQKEVQKGPSTAKLCRGTAYAPCLMRA